MIKSLTLSKEVVRQVVDNGDEGFKALKGILQETYIKESDREEPFKWTVVTLGELPKLRKKILEDPETRKTSTSSFMVEIKGDEYGPGAFLCAEGVEIKRR